LKRLEPHELDPRAEILAALRGDREKLEEAAAELLERAPRYRLGLDAARRGPERESEVLDGNPAPAAHHVEGRGADSGPKVAGTLERKRARDRAEGAERRRFEVLAKSAKRPTSTH
jgi:hypothetical protein